MKRINPNLRLLHNSIPKGINCCLEGGSRSAKTWSGIDFVVDFCAHNNRQVINIIRETYNSFKTTLYSDFDRRLFDYQIKNPFGSVQDIHQWKLWGNQINFIGADTGVKSKFEGVGCDVAWYNEFLDVPQMVFNQQEQRTRLAWWGDWNPKCTDHWVFNLEKRPDVQFLRTTIFDNPFASAAEKQKILGYEPTHPEDRNLPKDERRPHPFNITNGTADDFMWSVYGLGIRAALAGLIFPEVTWIDEFPNDLDWVGYGMDIGHTNSPTAIVKAGARRKDLFLQGLFYEPCDNPTTLCEVIDKTVGDHHIWADSAEKILIAQLRSLGYYIIPAPKPAGSVMDGITIMKGFKIHIVKNLDFKREQENYKYREVGGISLNEPVKGNDHYWDASRYTVVNEAYRN